MEKVLNVVFEACMRSDKKLSVMFAAKLLVLLPCLMTCVGAHTAMCHCDFHQNILNCSSLDLAEFNRSELVCGHTFRTIDLSRNTFLTFPHELSYYKVVDISNNRLTRLETGKKQNVELLDVSQNSISEINLLNSFPHLRNLYASGNNLGYSSDNFFKGWCTLEHLELSDNEIKCLVSATRCLSLSILVASKNLISQLPSNMTDLRELTMLYLSHNRINNVSGLPESLEILDLSHNEIEIITPSTLMNLASLNLLDLSYNAITNLEMRTFTSLQALQKLNLAGNDLIVLTDGLFQGMKSLQILDLSANKIESVSNGAFSGLPALEILNMSVNLITTVPSLRLGKTVKEVSLFFNHIRKINAFSLLAMFAGSEDSRFVDLTGNPFSGDDSGWEKLVTKFKWACEDKLKAKVESFLGEERPSVRYKFHKVAHTDCPCVLFQKHMWGFSACVRDEGEINGSHWLRDAKRSSLLKERKSGNYTVPPGFIHEEM